MPFETPLGPLTLRGRIDAVYADGEGGYEVIDWKTGPPPSGAELAAAAVQLAAYRLGWSRLTGVPVERVSAGFHHVAAEGDPPPGRPARRGRPAGPGHRHRVRPGALAAGTVRGRPGGCRPPRGRQPPASGGTGRACDVRGVSVGGWRVVGRLATGVRSRAPRR